MQRVSMREIDRRSLVTRHTPRMRCASAADCAQDFQTLGNGEFAFTADVTGLQTFNACAPLTTMSNWGWHTTPVPKSLTPDAKPGEFKYQQIPTYGRSVPYPTGCVAGEAQCGTSNADPEQAATTGWLRANPHRLVLGRLYFRSSAGDMSSATSYNQSLDMWSGVLSSHFNLGGEAVSVTTVVHPTVDMVAVKVESALILSGALRLGLDFPYGDEGLFSHGAVWGRDADHTTSRIDHAVKPRSVAATLNRSLDSDSYEVYVNVSVPQHGAAAPTLTRRGPHAFSLAAAGSPSLTASLGYFAPTTPRSAEASGARRRRPTGHPSFEETLAASASAWERFWQSGAAVDLQGSADARAANLENKIVMSQWVSRTQEAGTRMRLATSSLSLTLRCACGQPCPAALECTYTTLCHDVQ